MGKERVSNNNLYIQEYKSLYNIISYIILWEKNLLKV